MLDREKVIKKAERIMRSTVDRDMIDSFCKDVIDLLEEQEAVEPIPYDMKWNPDCEDCLPEGIDDCIECRKRMKER